MKTVITIAGISILDNSATLANAGVNYVIFDDWSKREKSKDQALVPLLTGLQKKLETVSEGRAFVVVPPPIQGIGNAGGFQMQLQLLGGSFDYARLGQTTDAMIKTAKASPEIERVQTTFAPSSPHVALSVDRVQAESMRVSVGDVFDVLTTYVGSTYINQFNKYGLSLRSMRRRIPNSACSRTIFSTSMCAAQTATWSSWRRSPVSLPPLRLR